MGKINILPEKVRSKIAAGEVVERPASAVKELVENSLDACSKKIFIDLEKGGKKLIRVIDDGIGIEEDDIPYVFSRYATSKIKDEKDLERVLSMGFRGEALYSIGVVSDVVLRSRTENSETGIEIHVRGGKEIGRKKVAMNKGTSVEVRELFFNIPARRKFLKSETTEYRQILNILLPYFIFFHNIEFKLTHNGRKIINIFPSNFEKRIEEVTGIRKENLIIVEKAYSNISIKLFLGDINIKRPRRDLQILWVNKRPVYNFNILNAVNKAYRSIFPPDVYPSFFISIDIPAELVDVNIHPTKREVKIKNEPEIINVVYEVVGSVLIEKGKGKRVEKMSVYIEKKEDLKGEEIVSEKTKSIFDFSFQNQKERVEIEEKNLKEKLKGLRFIGIFRDKYILFEGGNSLFVFDQHAVHERINYEKFFKQIKLGKIDIQRILSPLIIKLTDEEMAVYDAVKDTLEKYGFLTTKWSEREVAIHGFPSFLKNVEFAFRSIISEMKKGVFEEEKIAKSACRSSVMAGEKITEREAIALLTQLLECENPYVCPHGRPTVVEFPLSFFDRQFLR